MRSTSRLAGLALPQEIVAAGFSEEARLRARRDLAMRAQRGTDNESDD